MKKILLITLALLTLGLSNAQNVLNNAADNIVGTYSGTQDGEQFRAKITKLSNGTYQGQIIWMANDKDENGNKRLDTKNPDKKLRIAPSIILVLLAIFQPNFDHLNQIPPRKASFFNPHFSLWRLYTTSVVPEQSPCRRPSDPPPPSHRCG